MTCCSAVYGHCCIVLPCFEESGTNGMQPRDESAVGLSLWSNWPHVPWGGGGGGWGGMNVGVESNWRRKKVEVRGGGGGWGIWRSPLFILMDSRWWQKDSANLLALGLTHQATRIWATAYLPQLKNLALHRSLHFGPDFMFEVLLVKHAINVGKKMVSHMVLHCKDFQLNRKDERRFSKHRPWWLYRDGTLGQLVGASLLLRSKNVWKDCHPM